MRPGDVVWGSREVVDDQGRYRMQRSDVAVLATSRHKRRVSRSEGASLLGADVAGCSLWRWHSVTQTEVNDGSHCCSLDCEPGSWCFEGQGQAFVDVLYPPPTPTEDR